MLKSSRDAPPLPLATNTFPALVYASLLPSADHAASSPVASERRRGEPPRIGRAHNGPAGGTPCASITRSSEPSGDSATGIMFGEGTFARLDTSPPETDICAILASALVPSSR